MLPNGPYNPQQNELDILKYWLENKFFKPEYHKDKGLLSTDEMKNDGRDSFCIINPPPNAYMRPHIGNVSGYAYQDIFLRYNRLKGKKVFGQPGKDHAGIQGEVVLEKIFLENKGKTKHDMGREKFYLSAYSHFEKLMPKVIDDEQRIGLSSDYDRNLFTLDPKVVKTVLGTFEKMFNEKMIYKGVRIVNWDPIAKTTLSDIDTIREERDSELVYIKYPLAEQTDEESFIVVATTRPETMLGDTAVVVNPNDERYKDLVGKKLLLPLVNREIPIITSPHVDVEFGTGAVKLTPAHSMDDYKMMNEWNQQHPASSIQYSVNNSTLDYINVIDKDAKMTGPIPAKYKGLTTQECRKVIIEDLDKLGLIVKREPHSHAVMIGERSKAVIEQIMSSQWFIDVEKLKQPAIDAVKNKKIRIHPEYMEKKYLNWMENLHDWPVSRSLWWGYRIPVWYKGSLEEKIDQETGQIIETIDGIEIDNIQDALEKDLIKVQQDKPTSKQNGSQKLTLSAVRHGETDENRKGIFAGRLDAKLNQTGIEQAENFAITQDLSSFDLIITSPLSRAKDTAEIISKKTGIELIEDELLVERDFGILQGKTWDQICAEYPEITKDISEKYQEEIRGGESVKEVEARVDKFLEKVKKENSGRKILIVTHTGILRILRRKLGGETVEETRKNDSDNLQLYNFSNLFEENWIQDKDVLDTWFSSGQWPYATLIANDLIDSFYPTDIMETGYDILELWVSRMIMLGLYTQKEIPFKDVYLHGLVKAPDGQKMSKSKGNVIQPDEIISKYGADVLRLMYIVGNKAGAGYPINYEKLEGYKRFLNKIWNASKFVLSNIQDISAFEPENLDNPTDIKLLEKIEELKADIARHIEAFRPGLAAELIYSSFWHDFCDIDLESYKPRLYTKDKEGNIINQTDEAIKSRMDAQITLAIALKEYLKLMHPFIPFITETIWQKLPENLKDHKSIMYSSWD